MSVSETRSHGSSGETSSSGASRASRNSCAVPVDDLPPVVVDTREQRPYRYPGSLRGTLPSGDYSLLGLESLVAVERKEKADAYASLGRGRARF